MPPKKQAIAATTEAGSKRGNILASASSNSYTDHIGAWNHLYSPLIANKYAQLPCPSLDFYRLWEHRQLADWRHKTLQAFCGGRKQKTILLTKGCSLTISMKASHWCQAVLHCVWVCFRNSCFGFWLWLCLTFGFLLWLGTKIKIILHIQYDYFLCLHLMWLLQVAMRVTRGFVQED